MRGRPTIRDANGTEISETAVGNPYLFTGRRYDAETALYYYRARYCDYYAGRFLQPDPLGYTDGLNLYAYVANNPLNWVDPSGLCKSALGDALRFAMSGHPMNPARHLAAIKDLVTMGPDYYDVFRGVDYGRGEAAALATIMTLGKVIGCSTLLESIMGIDVRQQREIHGWERVGYIGVGGAQTLLSSVVLAEGLNWLTTPRFPSNPQAMDNIFGVKGRRVPDTPKTQGRGRVVWEPKRNVEFRYEQHPYDPGGPAWHTGPHYHYTNKPVADHVRYMPGDRIPNY